MTTAIGPEVTNGARRIIEFSEPYVATATITGAADFLFHRWNCEGVAEKAKSAKGSKAKKTDDLESYVYRTDAGELAIPGEYLRQAVIHAAKFRQDPRSPRKSAMDLFKAGVITLDALCTTGLSDWDYIHRARVQVQRNGVTRERPAIKAGWAITASFLVNLPEYIPMEMLLDVIGQAGRLVGVGDFRPTYGRFHVTGFNAANPT